ncbi:MAG: hypothetical protein HOV81_27285 [Kofleriaceae bacterium]|nr:hypothetical protein [Kofleriaceae bacterium]
MRLLFASLLFSAACSSAYADQVASPQPPGPRIAIAIAPDRTRAPYDVQVITEGGEVAPTYALRDRFYVQGMANERYTIKVTNPTARRVEAVVTVDGLDVVDGEAGDLRKRGYIVPAYGEVNIEGFRTSLADVATFRFSSVDDSYAGKKGKARNVGVIAVAIFEEAAPPPDQQIVQPDIARRGHDYRMDLDEAQDAGPAPGAARDRAPAREYAKGEGRAEKAPATAPAPTGGDYGGRVGGEGTASRAPARIMPRPPPPPNDDYVGDGDYEAPRTTVAPPTNRPGLGTEFGESRYSAASYTRFVRSASRPIAIAELRYNDVSGLAALGIPVAPMPDEGEIMMRETADPFPGDHFARPVR